MLNREKNTQHVFSWKKLKEREKSHHHPSLVLKYASKLALDQVYVVVVVVAFLLLLCVMDNISKTV